MDDHIMERAARRALRFWAVAGAIYGVLLMDLAARWLPWKSPWANGLLLAYGALFLVAAVPLWRARRWGGRLAALGALLGLAACALVSAGLLASWAWLWGSYGDFGTGAGIAALLFFGVGLVALGLVPGLLLRALSRPEVRALLGTGGGPIKILLGGLTLPLLAAAVGYLAAREPLPPRVSPAGRQQSVAHLRAALLGAPRPATPALVGVPLGAGPLYVTLWRAGRVVTRVSAEGADLAEAVSRAADALATDPHVHGRAVADGRLKLDRTVSLTRLPSAAPLLVALSLNPGVHGLRRSLGGASTTILPEDLVKRQRFGTAPLVPGIRELRLGLDARAVLARLGLAGGRLERLRTEPWVEFEGRALDAQRGNTPPSGTGPAAWRAAAIAGGDFVLRQLRPDGRFHYQYFPLTDAHPPEGRGGYSLPRHAGTVYSLALLYGHTQAPRFKAGAERAIAWLDRRISTCGAPDRACVVQRGRADLGSAALSVVGMVEYQRQTHDVRYAGRIGRLANFLLSMQRPDGDFDHVYDLKKERALPEVRAMFYSEEAALALVLAHEVLGGAPYLAAAERALDFLTGPKYDFFLGRFIYGADHWTCVAAHEAWPRLRSPAYLDFCTGYARFLARLQYAPGEWDNDDFRGHYGFSGLMVPQAPAAAGFSEAVVSTYALARLSGRAAPDLYRQVAAAMDALSRDQVRPDNAWMMPAPGHAVGGVRRSLVEQEVRIDFTQHALSALIRAAALIPPDKERS